MERDNEGKKERKEAKASAVFLPVRIVDEAGEIVHRTADEH